MSAAPRQTASCAARYAIAHLVKVEGRRPRYSRTRGRFPGQFDARVAQGDPASRTFRSALTQLARKRPDKWSHPSRPPISNPARATTKQRYWPSCVVTGSGSRAARKWTSAQVRQATPIGLIRARGTAVGRSEWLGARGPSTRSSCPGLAAQVRQSFLVFQMQMGAAIGNAVALCQLADLG